MPQPIHRYHFPACLAGLLLILAATVGCQTNRTADYGPDGVALAALAKEPIASRPWLYGQVPGVEIVSAHYRIYTTIRDPLYQRLLQRTLEAAYARFASLNPTARTPGLMDCYVFGDRNTWDLYTKANMGADAPTYLAISAGGYAIHGVFVGYDIGQDKTLGVIAHEAWHQYSWFAFKDRLPSWLDEGLATQNEAIAWDGANPHFEPRFNLHRWQALQAAINENRLWSLKDLTENHAGQVIKRGSKHVDSYYAQVWALILFLEHSKYRPNLEGVIRRAQHGELVPALANTGLTPSDIARSSERWNAVAGPIYLKRFIAEDITRLEAEYLAFCKQLAEQPWPPQMPK